MNLNISGQSMEGEIPSQFNQQRENQQTMDFVRCQSHKQHQPNQNTHSQQPLQVSSIIPADLQPSVQSTVDFIMNKIQLLEYQKSSFIQLSQSFKSIIGQHIGFKQILPFSKNHIGQKLLQDGLFHELWGIICRKVIKRQQIPNYYQQYYHLLTKNHSNFQKFYNNIDSSKELSKEVQYDTATNLFPITKAPNNFCNSQETHQPNLIFHSLKKKAPSFFDHIQTNQRRLKAQMVCYYLSLTSFYNLIDLNINSIFQFYQQGSKQLLILSAQAPQFSQSLGRQVIDYREKTLIAMYGYISLRQLLRIKTQYLKIDGFILYDELHNLQLWLKNNGYNDSI